MKTIAWDEMTPAARDHAVAREFNVEPKWDEQVGPPFSASLDACFDLAKAHGLPLKVDLQINGDVRAGVLNDWNYGNVPAAHAACIALLRTKDVEVSVKVL